MMEKLSSNPKVSVIMSVYNAEQTLRAAIDSILKQTYTNWEFIICNDFPRMEHNPYSMSTKGYIQINLYY